MVISPPPTLCAPHATSVERVASEGSGSWETCRHCWSSRPLSCSPAFQNLPQTLVARDLRLGFFLLRLLHPLWLKRVSGNVAQQEECSFKMERGFVSNPSSGVCSL